MRKNKRSKRNCMCDECYRREHDVDPDIDKMNFFIEIFPKERGVAIWPHYLVKRSKGYINRYGNCLGREDYKIYLKVTNASHLRLTNLLNNWVYQRNWTLTQNMETGSLTYYG